MTKPKVLISDALSPAAVQIFKDRGIEVDFQPNLGKDKDKLAEIIGNYDGLAIRSATKATAKIIEKATRLKVIGRAGIGVDNVEIPAATAKGIIVMNTPFGNSITTAEHAITLMLALAREIPQADASTQAGKWEKNRFMGVEITGKTLGVIGCGNIGSIVADRALGLRMKVIAFDPFLSPERAKDIGVEKVELDELFKRADFITLHTPLTEKTKNIIDAAALAKMKKGVRIINCARGGLVDEQALVDALNSKHVAGAAFDVFVEEPATSNVLFGHPNVICTPHLGAATTEAQENVALQVAEQMSDYLLSGAISNAVNFPSITAEEAPKLKPFIELAEKLGSFAGQLTETGIAKVQITYEGHVAEMKIKALTSAVLSGLLRPMLGDVNVVSAPVVAKERGMVVDEIVRAAQSDYESLITVTVTTERQERSVSGTVYADGKPRLVDIKGIRVDAEFGKSMIYVTNEDKPGFIGRFAGLLGDAKINIATFHLGRNKQGGDAIALVEVDGAVPADVLAKVQALPQVKLRKPDHRQRHHRAPGTVGVGHGLCRRQAAAGRYQGHPRRRRIRQVDDLRDQRGQAGLHRALRRPARRRQAQYRDLPSRPHQAGRRRHRAGRGRRRGTGRCARQGSGTAAGQAGQGAGVLGGASTAAKPTCAAGAACSHGRSRPSPAKRGTLPSPGAWVGRVRRLDAFVDQPCEEAGVDHELAEFCIEGRGRFGRDRLVARPALFLQRRNVGSHTTKTA